MLSWYNNKYMTHRKSALIFLFLAVLLAGGFLLSIKTARAGTGKVVGDKFNVPYPRIGYFIWTATPALLAQKGINLVMTSEGTDISAIKKINSKVLVSRAVDINDGAGIGDRSLCVKSTSGGCVEMSYGTLYDYTNPNYQSAVVERFAALSQGADFVTTTGLWDSGVVKNIAGMPPAVIDDWDAGRGKIVSDIRAQIGSMPFLVNGNYCRNLDSGLYNGSVLEYGQPFPETGWGNGWDTLLKCQNINRQPHLTILDGTMTAWADADFPGSNNEFKVMRFGLGTALMSDAYFALQRPGVGEDHFYIGYFDEYDLDLGYPTTGVLNLGCQGPGWLYQCLYVRFFDKGAVILNAIGESRTITDSDLKKLSNYKGPYYRFHGGQDPAWNNGQLFSSATLNGVKKKLSEEYEHYKIFGDSLILLNKPLAVVADVLIDEHPLTTSPGSKKTELNGSWQKSMAGDGFWHLYHSNVGVEPTYYAQSQDKNAAAIFRPTIGVPGRYRVYEWHGDSPEAETASAVYEIHSGEGVKLGNIDQSKNYGQWNYLSEVYLAAGTGNYLKLTNNSSGALIADAVKFEYQDAQLAADFNCDGKIDISDLGIILSHWGQKDNNGSLEKYKHVNCAEPKSLNLATAASSAGLIDAGDVASLLSCWGNPESPSCYR